MNVIPPVYYPTQPQSAHPIRETPPEEFTLCPSTERRTRYFVIIE